MIHSILSRVWDLLGASLRRNIVWLLQPKFVLGVSGIILDENGRVLLLKHRYWKNQAWGLPSGCMKHGETIAVTLARELREETGLAVEAVRLLEVRTNSRLSVEFVLLATYGGGVPRVCSAEILDARFFPPEALPGDLLANHRAIVARVVAERTAACITGTEASHGRETTF